MSNPDASGRMPEVNSQKRLTAFFDDLRRRSALKPLTELPTLEADVRQVGTNEDLISRFVAAATSAGLKVHRVSQSDWIARVREILAECGAKTVYIEQNACLGGSGAPNDCGVAGPDVEQLTAELALAGITVKSDTSDETLFSVDAGITGVTCAVAETGTLVCQSGPDRARGGSLIPPLHIALLSAAMILPDLCDCLALISAGSQLPANVNLITGPSKTADIEGILVTGVHGPREVHVILLQNAE